MFNNAQSKSIEMAKSVPQSSLGYAVDLNRNPYMHPDNLDIMGNSPNMVKQHIARIRKTHKMQEQVIHPGANDLKVLRPDIRGGMLHANVNSADISHSGFSHAYNIHPQMPHSKNMLLKKAGHKTLTQKRKIMGDPLMGQ
jgi:energy-converting hydrogenase A subunit M